MAASRRMVRFAVLGPVAGAVLVLNVRCEAFGGPTFGEQEMRAAAEARRAEIGERSVHGADFEGGRREVPLGEIAETARITARGEVREVASCGGDGRTLPSRLVRIAQ
jgi:hypothetical protein